MLLVKTRIGPSKIHGIGLFAAEFIPQGAEVWRFSAMIDRADDPTQDPSLHYAYTSKQTGRVILPGDDAKYINHSTSPNVGTRYET
ncbi:MAG: SET domain-containing protein-lysine N-methyltransferase, partial [Patescibacteria group bacterium]